MTFLLLFFGLLALVFIDVPIGIALGVVATVAMGVTSGIDSLPNVALGLSDPVRRRGDLVGFNARRNHSPIVAHDPLCRYVG